MSTPDRFVLKITSRPENLARVAEFVGDVTAQFGLTDQETYYIQMAVDEAVTNVIEHAYKDGEGPIEIIAERRGDEFIVTLRDQGIPFDPAAVVEPDVAAPLDRREVGGLGIYFMRRLMDDVSFRFGVDGWNELTMVRRRKVVSTSPSRYDSAVMVITPRGRLDASGSQYLETELQALSSDNQYRMVIDCQQVTYISSTGLRTLLLALRRAKKVGGDVKLAGLTPPVRKIIRMAGFDMILEIFETEEQAVRAFKK